MDDFQSLSDDAKQAWQRGFNLAHPRHVPARPRKNRRHAGDAREAEMTRAVDAVGDALESLASNEHKSFLAVTTGTGVNLVVMDPISVEAVIVELDNMRTDECREALGNGFLKGMIAKAKVATPDGTPPSIN